MKDNFGGELEQDFIVTVRKNQIPTLIEHHIHDSGESDVAFEGRLANILLCSGLGTELLIVDNQEWYFVGDNTMIHIFAMYTTCTNITYADHAHVHMHSNI